MIQPTQSVSFNFVADGESTVLSLDLSLLPTSINFRGSVPTAVLKPSITSTGTDVSIPTATYQLNGTTLVVTFATAPPEFDETTALIIYTLTFLLAFAT